VGHTGQGSGYEDTTTVLFDLAADPAQLSPIRDTAVEQRLLAQIGALMEKNDAPPEAFWRLDLPVPSGASN
jgi:chorismate mutase